MLRQRSSTRRSDAVKLTLTAIPVRFSTDHVVGGSLPYESREQLDDLRSRYSATHVFHRAGNSVLAVPLTEDVEPLGVAAQLRLNERGLNSRLVREALGRHFSTLRYTMRHRGHSIQLSASSRDMIAKLVSDSSRSRLGGLSLHPVYEFDVRLLHPRDKDPLCVVTLNARVRASISLTVEDLLRKGINLDGRYVASADDGRLLGRVASIQRSTISLEDSRNLDSVEASECVLEPRVENLLMCLSHISGVDEGSLRSRFNQASFGVTGALGKKEFVDRFSKHLESEGEFTAANGVTFQFGDVVHAGEDAGFPVTKLPQPEFVFHPTGNKTHRWHDGGLNLYGPFDFEFFSKKDPRIAVVTPRAYQGRVEGFLRNLKDGILNSSRFKKGFVQKYRLNDCLFDIHPFDEGGNSARSYREACLSAINGGPYDLAIVVTREEFHSFSATNNPYLVTKAALMSQGVPVQEIQIETIEGKGQEFILNNVALACYGKLGGIPYTILAPSQMPHELIIGLDSLQIGEGRLSPRSRVVGITTIFSSDGNYLLSNVAKEVAYEEYIEELKESLATSIGEISRRNAWQQGDKLRLVFHVFKPLKDSEAQAVKSFVKSLVDYNVEFAFLTLSYDHPLTILDEGEEASYGNGSSGPKGKLVPDRGWAVRTGGRELLVALTGPSQLKTQYQGCPSPVLIKLHRESTFNDLTYLGQQVYKFTFLSWRSFSPGALPVTTAYSQFIGRLLGQLSGLPNWNPDMLATHLRTSRWFL